MVDDYLMGLAEKLVEARERRRRRRRALRMLGLPPPPIEMTPTGVYISCLAITVITAVVAAIKAP